MKQRGDHQAVSGTAPPRNRLLYQRPPASSEFASKMITSIRRMSLVQSESKRAHSEMKTEELTGIFNRTHFGNALSYVALAELYAAKAVKELRKIRILKKKLEPMEVYAAQLFNQNRG